MIRLIQRRLIIPRGDTGSFSIPVLKSSADNIAVFTIFDETTHTKMFQKKIQSEGDVINIAFTHSDTVNLKPGKYVWDIKYYNNPEFIDDELVNGEEIDSYYAGFSLPVCEIRETADNYLVSPDAPTAPLSPEYLEIVTGAVHSLNEAIRKTQENVEHYPEIRDEVWYIWDAEVGDFVSTGVRANGIVGNGIASAVLNDDYTLTLNFTDGTSFTSPSIRGETGNGIDDIVLNSDYTLSIRYTDGEIYTTPSIRGTVGATPQFSIGTVRDGAIAAATITGTAENPVLNLTLPNAHVPTRVSQLENDANYAVDSNYVHTDNNYTTAEKEKLSGIAAGAEVNVNANWNAISGDAQILNKPTNVSDFTNDAGYLTEHQDISGKADKSEIPTKVSQLQNDSGYLTSFTETDPTVPAWAKTVNKPSYTAAEVGAPTVAEMNTAIGTAIGQINSFDMAVVQELPTQDISTHTIYLVPKTGETNDVYDEYVYINSKWEMVGNTQIDLSNYALKSELPTKVSELSNDSGYLTSYIETDPTVPQWAKASTKPSYTAAEVGALPSDTHIPNTTAELTNDAGFITVEEVPEVPVQDVQVNGVSVMQDGVANVPIASNSAPGVVKLSSTTYGIGINPNDNCIFIAGASNNVIKAGSENYRVIFPSKQHQSVFYGLAKAAGSDEKNSTLPVGQYTPEAKGAIQQMLGVSDLIATSENDLVASKAYAVGDVFTANGKLYRATAAIAGNEAIILQNEGEEVAGANATETNVGEGFVKFTDYATNETAGVSIVSNSFGLFMDNGRIKLYAAPLSDIKNAIHNGRAITPFHQHESAFYGLAKAAGDTTQAASNNTVGTYTDDAKSAIRTMLGAVGTTDYATNNGPAGLVKVAGDGLVISSQGEGRLMISAATITQVKDGASAYYPIVPSRQHLATFYGLAKAAGDTTQSSSSNAVGTYTDNAKASIKAMLGVQDGSTGTVDVTGTTPTITAVENTRYVCGEVTSLNFTPAASGICIVRFTSGSSVTVLTLPSTVKFPEWFDPTSLETNTIYEICITDGIYGAVMSWAL